MEEALLRIIEGAPGWIVAIALLIFVLRLLLPANKALNDANLSMIAQQQAISKNLEETYEKKLVASVDVIEQRLIKIEMDRDKVRAAELTKLKDEIHTQAITIGTLVAGRDEASSKIDVLEKKSAILDESNLAKDKQIEGLLAQVEKVTTELTSEREQNKKLMERVSSLELQIATLLAPSLLPPEILPSAPA